MSGRGPESPMSSCVTKRVCDSSAVLKAVFSPAEMWCLGGSLGVQDIGVKARKGIRADGVSKD